MERFVKPKGGAKNKSTGILKASSAGSFKPHKSKKVSTQLEKAKSLMITDDLRGLKSPPLCNRSPDPNLILSKVKDKENDCFQP